MLYLVYVTVQLASKSYSQTLPDPFRIEAGSAATAAHRGMMAAAKTDLVRRRKIAHWSVKVVPVIGTRN